MLGPSAGAMLNKENFDMIVPHSVSDDVSQIGQHKFTCPLYLAASPEESILRQQAQRPPVN